MYKLIRLFNQNKKKIIKVILIIVFAFLILQLLNYGAKLKIENSMVSDANTANSVVNDNSVNNLISNKSAISGNSVSSSKLENEAEIIEKFIAYCNNKELQQAYDLLTDECKTQMYTTLEAFEQAYYNDVFGGENKTCTIQNWFNNIYKVNITDDAITTGKSNNGYSKQDYMTVEKVDGEYKLNINNYIGYKQINKTTNQDNICMEVISKNTYMDYEEYTIKVTNNTDTTILLDSRTDVKTLYIQDSKGVQYSSYSHELTEPMLTIASGQTKEVTIKFYSSYVSTKTIKYIVFSDLLFYAAQEGQVSQEIEFKASV